MCATFEFVVGRVIIIEESQPVKNCKFSRLIANPRQNWSSERNSVYCFSTVFTLLQQQEVPSTCQSPNPPLFSFLIHQYVSDLYLTAN